MLVCIFDPALLTVARLPFSLVQLSPSPLPCVNKYTVYTYTVGGEGIWGSGPQTDKHLPQSPLAGHFFLDDDIAFHEFYLSTGLTPQLNTFLGVE